MKKLRKFENILPFPDDDKNHDFSKIHDVIQALDYLRHEAKDTGSDDIYGMINSCFNICFTVYYFSLRQSLDTNLQ